MATPVRSVSSSDVTAYTAAKAPEVNAIRSDVLLALTEFDKGTTANRPGSPVEAQAYFDTDINTLLVSLVDGSFGMQLGARSALGALALGEITDAPVSNQNDYAPTGYDTAGILSLTGSTDFSITGIAAPSDGGRFLHIQNRGTAVVTLVQDSTSSSASNRLAIGTTTQLRRGDGITLIYTNSRWRRVDPPRSEVFTPVEVVNVSAAGVTADTWHSGFITVGLTNSGVPAGAKAALLNVKHGGSVGGVVWEVRKAGSSDRAFNNGIGDTNSLLGGIGGGTIICPLDANAQIEYRYGNDSGGPVTAGIIIDVYGYLQ